MFYATTVVLQHLKLGPERVQVAATTDDSDVIQLKGDYYLGVDGDGDIGLNEAMKFGGDVLIEQWNVEDIAEVAKQLQTYLPA